MKESFNVVIELLFITLTVSFIVTTPLATNSIHATITDKNSTRLHQITMNKTTKSSENILLVYGAWSDGSIWNKVIPTLLERGHKTMAVQLPLNSLEEDIAITKRAISLFGGPTILVGHSYGGVVITNAGNNNSNVTGLVYLAAIAPDEGENVTSLIQKLPNADELLGPILENIYTDGAGLSYFNLDKIPKLWSNDIDRLRLELWA